MVNGVITAYVPNGPFNFVSTQVIGRVGIPHVPCPIQVDEQVRVAADAGPMSTFTHNDVVARAQIAPTSGPQFTVDAPGGASVLRFLTCLSDDA